MYENRNFTKGTKKIYEAIEKSKDYMGYSVYIGGVDTLSITLKFVDLKKLIISISGTGKIFIG